MRNLLLVLGLAACTASTFAAAPYGYLFTTFRDNKGDLAEQIYFGLSRDGLHWTAVNGGKPDLVSNVGTLGVRDPFLLRAQDGQFYIVATDLSISRLHGDWGKSVREGSHCVVIWESTDLVKWTGPRLAQVAPDDAGCTWAPEAIYDPAAGDYLIYWASTTARDQFAKHRIWAVRTKDFKTFGKPFIYVEKPMTVIDTAIIRDGGVYYRFTKDEKFKAISMERAPRLDGPWTDVPGFTLAKLTGYEGPACFPIGVADDGKPGTWCLMLDHYAKGLGYEAFITHDLASGVFTPATGVSFPFHFRHGSVLPLSEREYRRIEEQSKTGE